MKFILSFFFCLFLFSASSEKLAIHILLDPTDPTSAAYVHDEVSKVTNSNMANYVIMYLLPGAKMTYDDETQTITVPGDEKMRQYLAAESCIAENASINQAVRFFDCINENKDLSDVDFIQECLDKNKIKSDVVTECLAEPDKALLALHTMYKKAYELDVPYYPFVLIEGRECENSCPDLYHKICEFYPADFKPYLCRIPVPKPLDIFDNNGEIIAHYENPADAPGSKSFEKVSRNVNLINVKVLFDPTQTTQKTFLDLFEDMLYKDFRYMTNLTFYPIGHLPRVPEGETITRNCGESDPECKILKHMLCGWSASIDDINYWSYLSCMTRHGEYMFNNVDYCASSAHIYAPSIHECLDSEEGNKRVDDAIQQRNIDYKDVDTKEIPVVYINQEKCINNCGDMYMRICSVIPGKLPVFCGGVQRLAPVLPPCPQCRRDEVLRPPGEIDSFPVEIFMDASCKWCNKFISGPVTWLYNHKRFINSVDLFIHPSFGCYVNDLGLPICPLGPHQTTQNLILACTRDLWPDYKIHNPLMLCFSKYFNEYEKHIDECADENNVDPQAIVDCVNDGRGTKAMERYFKRTRQQFDPISIPAVKLQNETVYEYNRSIEMLCDRLNPIPKFCKKLPKFPKKSPVCKSDDLSTWPEM